MMRNSLAQFNIFLFLFGYGISSYGLQPQADLSELDRELLAAASSDDWPNFNLALTAGANPNAHDEFGPALVITAMDARVYLAPMIFALLAAGADPKSVDIVGETVLHHLLPRIYHPRGAEIFRRLLAAGADPAAVNRFGRSVRDAALVHGRGDLLPLLDAALAVQPGEKQPE